MSVQEIDQLEIIIVIPERIVQVGGHVQPANVEEEVKDEKDGNIKIKVLVVPDDPLPSHEGNGKVEVDGKVDHLNGKLVLAPPEEFLEA